MFGLKRMVCALAVGALMFGAVKSEAQQDRRQRRLNANRQARIAKTIEDTYAQKWEIFGGVGYLRFRSGEFLQRNNEVSWNVSVGRYFNPRWAVVGDVRGNYGNAKIGNNSFITFQPLIGHYTFMAGPQYRFYRKEKLSASVNVLGGVARGNFDGGTKGVPAPLLGMWETGNAGAFSVNPSVDYNFYPNLAMRLTPTYELTMFGSSKFQHNAGVSVGVIYRFGRNK